MDERGYWAPQGWVYRPDFNVLAKRKWSHSLTEYRNNDIDYGRFSMRKETLFDIPPPNPRKMPISFRQMQASPCPARFMGRLLTDMRVYSAIWT